VPFAALIPAGLVHHARQHPAFHLDHGELDVPLQQALQDDAADESGPHQDDACPRIGQLGDVAGILERPAVVYARQVQSRNRRLDRAGPGRQQQLLVGQRGAVGEDHAVGPRVHLAYGIPADLDPQLVVMVPGLAQIGSGFLDTARQVVGYGHPRIRRLGLPADKDDVALRVHFAQRFCCDHACRTSAADYVPGHVSFPSLNLGVPLSGRSIGSPRPVSQAQADLPPALPHICFKAPDTKPIASDDWIRRNPSPRRD
jgi:hypothetical protein